MAGASSLITLAAIDGNPWKIVGSGVYGGALVFLYSISTLYHSLQGRAKQFFLRLDYIAIYLLIAGSYTPFTLITLHGPWGWWLFGIIWGLAALGITLELLIGKKTHTPSLVLYLIMGWMILIAIDPLIEVLPTRGLFWLAAGGALYTGGVFFFLKDDKFKHFHGIWHLFVLGGSICQFICIALYLI